MKKFFAVAMATTMALSTAVIAMAETKDVTIGAGFSANTGEEILSGDFDVTYTLTDKSLGTNNWDNFIVELHTKDAVGMTAEGAEAPVFIDVRADNFGWLANATDGATLAFGDGAADWSVWADSMRAGSECKINITRKEETFTYTIEAAGAVFKATTTATDFKGQDVVLYLTGENCELTNVKFVDNTKTEVPSEETTAEKPTEETDTKAPTAEKPTEETTTEAPTTEKSTEETTTEAQTEIAVSEKEVEKIVAEAKVEGLEDAGLDKDTKITASVIAKDSEVYKKTIEFVNEKFSKKNVAVIDLKLTDIAGSVIDKQPSGKIKVTIPVLESVKKASKVEVFRFDEEAQKFISLGVSDVADGKISFETDHFSTYLFVDADKDKEEAKEETTTKKEETPKTGDSSTIVIFAVIACAAVAGVVVSRKKVTE